MTYFIDAFMQLDLDKKLVNGFVTCKELDELCSNVYMYVLPSEIEGLPISLLEAMSYGNCCLTSEHFNWDKVTADTIKVYESLYPAKMKGEINKVKNEKV